jgi:hypothetical protein
MLEMILTTFKDNNVIYMDVFNKCLHTQHDHYDNVVHLDNDLYYLPCLTWHKSFYEMDAIKVKLLVRKMTVSYPGSTSTTNFVGGSCHCHHPGGAAIFLGRRTSVLSQLLATLGCQLYHYSTVVVYLRETQFPPQPLLHCIKNLGYWPLTDDYLTCNASSGYSSN